jgi:biotin carboxyl carrier protein
VAVEVHVHGRRRQVNARKVGSGFLVTVDGRAWAVDAVLIGGHTLSLLIVEATSSGDVPDRSSAMGPGGASYEVEVVPDRQTGEHAARVAGRWLTVGFNGPRRSGRREETIGAAGPQRIVAPMPGKIARILVSPGDVVRPRQPVVVVEAMKMENELRALRQGRVAEVLVADGQRVEAGTVLAVITDE